MTLRHVVVNSSFVVLIASNPLKSILLLPRFGQFPYSGSCGDSGLWLDNPHTVFEGMGGSALPDRSVRGLHVKGNVLFQHVLVAQGLPTDVAQGLVGGVLRGHVSFQEKGIEVACAARFTNKWSRAVIAVYVSGHVDTQTCAVDKALTAHSTHTWQHGAMTNYVTLEVV